MTITPMILQLAMQELVGKKCWKADAGPNRGSEFLMSFGEKWTYDQPYPGILGDPWYVGEYTFHVLLCPWRIEDQTKILASWRDSNRQDGPIVEGLMRFQNSTIIDCRLNLLNLDVIIESDSGVRLTVFYDKMPFSRAQYLFTAQHRLFILNGNGVINQQNSGR